MHDATKLTVYFGESDRVAGELLSDVLAATFARHELRLGVLLRGIEGFGAKHRLHTQRLLTLSEDLPLVAVAVDAPERIERVLPEVTAVVHEGLVTLERARFADGAAAELPAEAKLTVYLGRKERARGRPAYLAVVDLLRASGVASATVFLGVDGTVRGRRERARFFSRNPDVPLMVVCVGSGASIARALPELPGLATIERVRICKRDGRLLAEPELEAGDVWHKLMVYAGEQARHAGRPLYVQLVERLRLEGAPGATAVRGIWGYSGEHEPHGDSARSLRRRVPVVTVLVDRPAEMRRWWPLVDELTDETGLVTSELVPAFAPRAQ